MHSQSSLMVVAPTSPPQQSSHPGGYVIGAIISLLILVYLIYSLVKPEKF